VSGEVRFGSIDELRAVQRACDRMLLAEGAGHLVHDLSVGGSASKLALASRPWRLDPIPVTLSNAAFDRLADEIRTRLTLWERVLADLYGERRLVADGIIPPAVVHSSPRYRLTQVGAQPPARWLTTYALDVLQLTEGRWTVVGDLTDAPPGLGYAVLNRSVLARCAPSTVRDHGVAPLTGFLAAVRRALAATSSSPSPRLVVFSGGVDDPSFVEQSYLATQLGFNLVEGGDLVVRDARVWLRTIGGLEPVDVLYRRLDDDAADPLHVDGHDATGVPGLGAAARSSGVAVANALGSGLAEERALWPYLGAAADVLGVARPSLPQFDPASDCAAVVPALDRDGLHDVRVVIRLHAVAGPDGITVLPGGTGRVLAAGDDPLRPTAALAKDVWVARQLAPAPAGRALPQVDLGASLPTRAADAVFGLGRALERAEVAARAARTVVTVLDEDPGLAAVEPWVVNAVDLLAAARVAPADGAAVSARPPLEQIDAAVAATQGIVVDQLGLAIAEALTVRGYLSTTTGRVLGRLPGQFERLRGVQAVDALDAVLADLAALAGLWSESTVRGPAWRFGDLGRRLERALAVVGSVEAVVGTSLAGPSAPALEMLLAANESLVAYRRHHRSDVERDAVLALLLDDDTNPRGLAFQIDRIREHVVGLEWGDGVAMVDAADRARVTEGGDPVKLVLAVRASLLDLGGAVFQRWFAAPVSPHVSGRWR
jgi:uncharacterized circularly permuted ATP-grasp superfamily protein/uncharacterized alpha-E superfamily protein